MKSVKMRVKWELTIDRTSDSKKNKRIELTGRNIEKINEEYPDIVGDVIDCLCDEFETSKDEDDWMVLNYYTDGIDLKPEAFSRIIIEGHDDDWSLAVLEIVENPWDKIECQEVEATDGMYYNKICALVRKEDKLNNLHGEAANYRTKAEDATRYGLSKNVEGAIVDPSGRVVEIVYAKEPKERIKRKPRQKREQYNISQRMRSHIREVRKAHERAETEAAMRLMDEAARKKAKEVLSGFVRNGKFATSFFGKDIKLKNLHLKVPDLVGKQLFRDYGKLFQKQLRKSKITGMDGKPQIVYKRYAERQVYIRKSMIHDARISDTAVKSLMKSGVGPNAVKADMDGMSAAGRLMLYKNFYHCFVVALFFQILVSNTPIDEDYSFERTRPRVRQKRTSHFKDGKLKSVSEFVADKDARLRVTTEKHVADEYKVRADWVLSFRGKNFKAFNSKMEPGSDTLQIDYMFYEDWFKKKSDVESAMKIAQALYIHTGRASYDASNDKLMDFGYQNLNPRWELLEYGGYVQTSNNGGARRGNKYRFKHGVKQGFTFQAPKGFVRLAEAYWNSKLKSNQLGTFITSFVKDMLNGERLSASKDTSRLVKELVRQNGDIGSHQVSADEVARAK